MIVSVDTNILIQASINDGKPRKMLEYICRNYRLVLSERVISEYSDVISRDYIICKYQISNILDLINYEIIKIPKYINYELFSIRDPKDYIILYSLLNVVDILITNDKDFEDVEITKPRIMTPLQFSQEFMQEDN